VVLLMLLVLLPCALLLLLLWVLVMVVLGMCMYRSCLVRMRVFCCMNLQLDMRCTYTCTAGCRYYCIKGSLLLLAYTLILLETCVYVVCVNCRPAGADGSR
jgi:hypothetical protein